MYPYLANIDTVLIIDYHIKESKLKENKSIFQHKN